MFHIPYQNVERRGACGGGRSSLFLLLPLVSLMFTNVNCQSFTLVSAWLPRGTFRFERPDGSHFDVRIPPFSLESNKDEKTPPSGLHW